MDERGIFDRLTKAGMTSYGACGLMGNLYAESGFKFNALENLCRKRLKEAGLGDYTDEAYTAAVDSGAISREEFLNPLPGKQYGYGIAQWTTPARKAGMYDLAKSRGRSIADPDTQIDWLLSELKTEYMTVWNVLTSADSVREASDAVLDRFECPADRSESVRAVRAGYGERYFEEFRKAAGMNEIEKVIATARAEVGYLEKKTNSQLDDKTANAGNSNWTKYGRDMKKLDPAVIDFPAAWCDCFVDWCFVQALGADRAEELLHGFDDYTPGSADRYKAHGEWHTKDPKPGDQIFFNNGTRISHTGIVTRVEGDTVYTIEGNTSSGAEVIPNGGAVCEKSYSLGLNRISGYGRPEYRAGELQAAGTVEITTDLNIRAEPDGAVLGVYHKGDHVSIFVKSGKWFKTDRGWISRNCCRGWIQEPGLKWWYIDNGTFPVLTVKEIGGNEYAFDHDGWMITPDRIGSGGEIIY